MTSAPSSRSKRRTALLAAPLLLLLALVPSPVLAQEAQAPDSFSVNVAGTGMLVEISAPAALPLDVLVGISYAQVGVNSQPRIQSTAAPMFVPLFDAFPLLGGTSGVLGVVVRLAPGLVVGSPSLIGLDPIPVDPSLVPVDPIADAISGQPLPDPPQLGCTSNYPDSPRQAECGGGAQDFFGYRVGAGSARTTSDGVEDDPSALQSRSDASATGISPGASSPLAPVSVGSVAATSESKVIDGRITAVSSAGASDIDIAGLLSIESVQASFSAALGGSADTLGEEFECNISGVRSGGQEIELGADAITIAGSDTPVGGEAVGGLVNDVILGNAGGEAGPADFGNITVIPNPGPVEVISPDGTSLERRFGCLEVRYRNTTAGTDVRLTFGNVSAVMTAFNDVPFDPGGSTDVTGGSGGTTGGSASDSLAGGPVSVGSPATGSSGSSGSTGAGSATLALPDTPAPGSGAPRPTAHAFLETANIAGWGIDGGWLAPFSLLALSIPVLMKSRRKTFLTDRR